MVLVTLYSVEILRGPGYGEAVNIMERLVDAAARQCGFDRAELRRINMGAGRFDANDQCRRQ